MTDADLCRAALGAMIAFDGVTRLEPDAPLGKIILPRIGGVG